MSPTTFGLETERAYSGFGAHKSVTYLLAYLDTYPLTVRDPHGEPDAILAVPNVIVHLAWAIVAILYHSVYCTVAVTTVMQRVMVCKSY